MVKKREDSPILISSPSSEDCDDDDESCKQRAFRHKKRTAKKEAEELKRSETTSHCDLDTSSRRKRPKREINSTKKLDACTEKVSKRVKLDSITFESYMDCMWSNFSEDRRASCGRLDSLWFFWYLQEKSKVLSWIKKRNIFSKKYVFVPIVGWGHWRLLILCHFGDASETRNPCMLLLDSLQMTEPGKLEPSIRNFIVDIYEAEDRPESRQIISQIPLLVPKVPQQRDGDECGYFVLYFINLFIESAPEHFSVSEGYPYFMKKDWFKYESFERFCKQYDNLENETHRDLNNFLAVARTLKSSRPRTL